MAQPSTIPQQLMTAALLHFEQGVPIDDCNCLPVLRERLARVSHVYWIWKQNPFLETFPMFKQLVHPKCADKTSEWHMAKKDQALLDFVVQHVVPTDRKVMEARVRASANHLMKMGMETDNAFAIADGAKIAMKLDRLDQPESEQADMAKAHFISPIVTTTITDVDKTKIDYDDKQSLAIMNEFGAYIDPKRQMIDDKVAILEAKGSAVEMEEIIEDDEQNRDESDE